MLKMEQSPTLDFQHCTTLTQLSVADVEATMNQHCTTSMQLFFNIALRRFNVVSKLIWRYPKVVSTDPQRQLKLYRNQSG